MKYYILDRSSKVCIKYQTWPSKIFKTEKGIFHWTVDDYDIF